MFHIKINKNVHVRISIHLVRVLGPRYSGNRDTKNFFNSRSRSEKASAIKEFNLFFFAPWKSMIRWLLHQRATRAILRRWWNRSRKLKRELHFYISEEKKTATISFKYYMWFFCCCCCFRDILLSNYCPVGAKRKV